MTFRIRETDAFLPLADLFLQCGLEVTVGESLPPDTLKMWRCEDGAGNLIGAATLRRTKGCYVLDNLAVAEKNRCSGIGMQLMDAVLEEVKARGAAEIWGCAKVPEYYLTKGWVKAAPEDTPEIFHCLTCRQYQVSCFPCIIRKALRDDYHTDVL